MTLRRVPNTPTPAFQRHIGITYSGAETPDSGLKGLRIGLAVGDAPAADVAPPPGPRRYWTRRGVAEWLTKALADGPPTLVGIAHPFSFPLRYFEVHQLPPDWDAFLDDFQRHWPTDGEHMYVDFVRDGSGGDSAARSGSVRWRRLTEERAGNAARSVFQFEGQGTVAKAAHAGIPWLRFLRRRLGARVHFWPFDGWAIPAGRSALVELCPALCKPDSTPDGRDRAAHTACAMADRLQQADRDGHLADALGPALRPGERPVAQVEGWILGVG